MGVDRLINRCIEREPAAWRELLELYRPVILRVLVRAVGSLDPAVITDLEQELWLRLLADDCQSLRRLQGVSEGGVRGYLCTTAFHLALDQRRRLGVRRAVLRSEDEAQLDGLPDPVDGPERAYEHHEKLRKIFETVESLTRGPHEDRDRMIFKAHHFDGMSASEIASMGVGLSQKGVETLLFRLANRVREAIRLRAEDAA